MYSILYVRSDFDGPVSGFCEKDSNLFWFRCLSDTKTLVEDRKFEVLKLSKEKEEILIDDHIQKCKTFSLPIKHGDPYPINVNDTDKSIKILKHEYASVSIEGDIIGIVETNSFSNYFVPRVLAD